MIGEIISGVSALAEIVINVITFPLQYLGKKPETGESQHSARRVAIAISPAALIVAAVVGFVAWEKRKSHQQQVTQDAVEQLGKKLEKNRLPNGRFERTAGQILANDAWGRSLQVRYEEFEISERIIVSSLGRDGLTQTRDDIEYSSTIVLKREIVKAAARKVSKALKEKFSRDD